MRGLISAIAFAGFLSLVLQPQAVAEDWRYSGVERVVAVSDVHGAYDSMITTLGKAGVLRLLASELAADPKLYV